MILDHYEEGFDTEILDQFFNTLKKELVPLLHQIMESDIEIDQKILTGDFSEEKQEKIGRYLAEYVGFDFNKGVMAVSAHPFTTNLHNHDVRITTAYNNRVDDSMFSVIHESGHGIYEMGIPDELTQTPLGEEMCIRDRLYITQVFLAVGGAIKFIPSTGVTLPLVSYGGSSVLSTFMMFGVCLLYTSRCV